MTRRANAAAAAAPVPEPQVPLEEEVAAYRRFLDRTSGPPARGVRRADLRSDGAAVRRRPREPRTAPPRSRRPCSESCCSTSSGTTWRCGLSATSIPPSFSCPSWGASRRRPKGQREPRRADDRAPGGAAARPADRVGRGDCRSALGVRVGPSVRGDVAGRGLVQSAAPASARRRTDRSTCCCSRGVRGSTSGPRRWPGAGCLRSPGRPLRPLLGGLGALALVQLPRALRADEDASGAPRGAARPP